ncbi:MAG: histidinol-phosphate transaminase [Microthrixaceae bacterium]|nr:histidinol-phosphate transaminase [Microthrixaceae bacterium]MCO5313727.1 histidinol-phosphate transaminase [Microthrixaceae bacterium]HPB45250.1 histidinol-phosphate transaminase [Microthrixaceae bacterium]
MSRPKVRDDVAMMEGYHSPQLDVSIRLNTNEAPQPPPPEFTRRLAEAIGSIEWHRYPSRSASALRARIAEVEGVEADQVFAANGSNEVLQTVLLTYGGPGRTALTFEPTYALHSHLSRIAGTAVVEGERTDEFELDLDVVETLIARHRPAVTFLCSPNNPTGRFESEATIRRVLELVEAVDGLLIVDEAYGQFAPWSAKELLSEDRNLVVTRTYSKTWSMAAARLGYALAPSWLVAELDKVVLPYHLDASKQIAGLLALDYLDDMSARVAALVEERGRVQSALADLDVDQWESGANFILFRPRHRSGAQVWQDLVDRSILVRNCASWPRLDDCLRLTLGTAEENTAFLDALAEILETPTP